MSQNGVLGSRDVLVHIFSTYYSTGWEYAHGPFETNYMRGLYPLAAVCSAWRSVAKEHFLLKHLALEVTKPPSRGRRAAYFRELFSNRHTEVLHDMGAFGHIQTQDSRFIFHTNAHMVSYEDNRVSTLFIYLGNNVTTNDLLTALEQIGFAKRQWPMVTALHVVIDRMYVPGVANANAIREPLYHKLNSIGVAIDWIFKMAPHIVAVKLGSRAQLPYPMQIPLQASIMDNLGQLRQLEMSSQFCSFTIPPLFPPLTVLSICPVHHTLNFVLAKIDACCLKKLRLYQISPLHFFQSVGINSPSTPMEFPELAFLDLQFTAIMATNDASQEVPDDWYNRSGTERLLRFPKLRTVSIHDYYYDISGIVACFQHAPLHTLYFSTHPWVYLTAGIHRLTQLQRIWLTFEVRLNRSLPDDFFQPLLEMRTNTITELTFYSSKNIIQLPLTQIHLHNLRTLDLDLKLTFSQTIGFLNQLPSLTNLRFILDTVSVDRSPTLDLFQTDLAMSNRSLQHMVVVFNPMVTELGNEPDSMAVLHNILVLAAHLPALGRLRTCFTVMYFKQQLKRAMAVRQFAYKARHLQYLKYISRAEC